MSSKDDRRPQLPPPPRSLWILHGVGFPFLEALSIMKKRYVNFDFWLTGICFLIIAISGRSTLVLVICTVLLKQWCYWIGVELDPDFDPVQCRRPALESQCRSSRIFYYELHISIRMSIFSWCAPSVLFIRYMYLLIHFTLVSCESRELLRRRSFSRHA